MDCYVTAPHNSKKKTTFSFKILKVKLKSMKIVHFIKTLKTVLSIKNIIMEIIYFKRTYCNKL